ncbi:hypothetical protein QO002_005259 [Pararhizobium capsulatum DSM 1112]|nr:hypothetical protein [Pararhizobium capsulatum]MDQ0323053.1 hypothetical protein [Pararhizobium capsulatum DSM 1112]
MIATFQVIALSSLDPQGEDTRDEPRLNFADAVMAAQELKAQGKAFRVVVDGEKSDQQMQTFRDLGALS